MNGEKRYVPGTDPKWGKELPDGYDNSLVDKAGNSRDNGWNFDEKSDDEDYQEFDPEAARKAKEEASDHEKSAE